MATTKGRLAERLRKAIQESNVSVDELAARKIPRAQRSVHLLRRAGVGALARTRVPSRHLSILARELGIDVRDTQDLFNSRILSRTIDVLPPPRFQSERDCRLPPLWRHHAVF